MNEVTAALDGCEEELLKPSPYSWTEKFGSTVVVSQAYRGRSMSYIELAGIAHKARRKRELLVP
jgi:hypothetical protein